VSITPKQTHKLKNMGKTKLHSLAASAAIVLLVGVLSSCQTSNVEEKNTEIEVNGIDLKIYVIDSCEYIGLVRFRGSDVLTHKGNCKFCYTRHNP